MSAQWLSSEESYCVVTRIYTYNQPCVYGYIYIYIYIYIYTHMYIYIYIYRERCIYIYIYRERERYICIEREIHITSSFIYIYIYIAVLGRLLAGHVAPPLDVEDAVVDHEAAPIRRQPEAVEQRFPRSRDFPFHGAKHHNNKKLKTRIG